MWYKSIVENFHAHFGYVKRVFIFCEIIFILRHFIFVRTHTPIRIHDYGKQLYKRHRRKWKVKTFAFRWKQRISFKHKLLMAITPSALNALFVATRTDECCHSDTLSSAAIACHRNVRSTRQAYIPSSVTVCSRHYTCERLQ